MSDFLIHNDKNIAQASITFLGNLMQSSQIDIIQCAIDTNIFTKILIFLKHCKEESVMKECFWIMSNILATKGHNI